MVIRVALNNAGLRVSKPGFNALTTADENLLFSSDANSLPIVVRASTFIPSTIGSGTVTLNYGMAFDDIPLSAVFVSTTDVGSIADPEVIPEAAANATFRVFGPDRMIAGGYHVTDYDPVNNKRNRFYITKYTNRITFHNEWDTPVHTDPYWGYVYLVIFDFL